MAGYGLELAETISLNAKCKISMMGNFVDEGSGLSAIPIKIKA